MEKNDSPDEKRIGDKRNSISRSETNVETIGAGVNGPKIVRRDIEPDTGKFSEIKDLKIIINGAGVIRGILKIRKGKADDSQNGPPLHDGSGRKDRYGNSIIGGSHKIAWAPVVQNVIQVQSYKKHNSQVISRNDCCKIC
jgi:hypothetical protein